MENLTPNLQIQGKAMTELCKHGELFWGSGGYYIFCKQCSRRWVAWKPGAAEYGPSVDQDGADIDAGADGCVGDIR